MDTVRVYRIERAEDRQGPYCAWWPGKGDLYGPSKFHGRPVPTEDGPGHWMDCDEYCGFPTIKKMNEWMHGVKKPLRAAGFIMAVYDVPTDAAVVLEHQVCFRRDEATHVTDRRIP